MIDEQERATELMSKVWALESQYSMTYESAKMLTSTKQAKPIKVYCQRCESMTNTPVGPVMVRVSGEPFSDKCTACAGKEGP